MDFKNKYLDPRIAKLPRIEERTRGNVAASRDAFEELSTRLLLPVDTVIVEYDHGGVTVSIVPDDMRCVVILKGFGLVHRDARTHGLAWLLHECGMAFNEHDLYNGKHFRASGLVVFTPYGHPALLPQK